MDNRVNPAQDPANKAIPTPANGLFFVEGGTWWVDPATGDRYQANGYGYFEGLNGCCIVERPNYPLQQGNPSAVEYRKLVAIAARHGVTQSEINGTLDTWNVEFFGDVPFNLGWDHIQKLDQRLGGVRYGKHELQQLIADMQQLSFDAAHVYRELRDRSVITRFEPIDPPGWNPESGEEWRGSFELAGIFGYTPEIDQQVREGLTAKAAGRAAAESQKSSQIGKQKGAKQSASEVLMATKTQTDNSQLQVEWEKLHSDAEKAGLPDGIVTELLIRICKDLKQDVKLTPTTLTELQNALKLEISLAGSQQSEPVTPAQPETLASPVQPVETDSQTNGTNPHERRKQLLLEVFGPDVLLDMDEAAACPETLLGAIKAKADNFGITPADVDMRHRAIANLRELMSLEVIDELDDKVNEIIEKRLQEAPEPLQPVVPQELPTVTVPAESQSNKQTRTRRAKVETSKEKSDNQSHKAKAPPAIFALEGHTLTNCFTGEVKQASVIEERLALLLLKKSNIEKLLKQVKQDIDGMLACYKLGILEIARPEFARQRKPDGTFRRSSLVSEYLIVTRKTTGGIVCADTKARDSWLAGMDYATTQLYGDAIRVSYSVNADALPKLAKEDALPPGYIQAEEDDIGDIAIKINPKAFADEDDGGADQDGDE